jgi:hypothetical protein
MMRPSAQRPAGFISRAPSLWLRFIIGAPRLCEK